METIAGPPVAEDFGLTEDILEQTPDAFLVRNRSSVLIVTIAVAVAGLGAALLMAGTSFAASVFFAPILVVASLILMLPVAIALVCLAGVVETRLRSRSNPRFAACTRFREAYDRFQHTPLADTEGARRSPAYWTLRGESDLLRDVRAEVCHADVLAVDKEITGIDLIVRNGQRTSIIRCEAGRQPVRCMVGRELAAVLADLKGDDAVLVAPAGATADLKSYVDGRNITVLDAAALSAGRLRSLFTSKTESE